MHQISSDISINGVHNMAGVIIHVAQCETGLKISVAQSTMLDYTE